VSPKPTKTSIAAMAEVHVGETVIRWFPPDQKGRGRMIGRLSADSEFAFVS